MFRERVEQFTALAAAELGTTLRDLELQQRRLTADVAAATPVIEHTGQYLDDGHRSMKAYLKANLNCSNRDATRRQHRARLCNQHPDIADALAAGHIGVEQVDVLAQAFRHPRAGHRFAEFASALLEHGEHLEFNQFHTVVERFIMLADPDGATPDRGDDTATVTEVDGQVFVRASGGDPLVAATMMAVFEQYKQAEFHADCETRREQHGDTAKDHELPRTGQQRAFAALQAIFTAAVTAPADGQVPAPLVNFMIDERTAAELLSGHGLTPPGSNPFTDPEPDSGDGDYDVGDTDHRCGGESPTQDLPVTPAPAPAGSNVCTDLINRWCETSTGIVVDPHQVLQAMIHGHVRRVVVNSAKVIIDMGRTRRLFTGKARQAAQLLAVTCYKNGCDIPAQFCDVDHLQGWIAGGVTDQNDAAPMCGVHDRDKHDRHLTSRRAANGRIYQIRPDGTVIAPVGERPPAWADPDPPPRPPLSPPSSPNRNDDGLIVQASLAASAGHPSESV